MEKEEIILEEELGRLEIEPIKTIKNRRNIDNPFTSLLQQKNFIKKPIVPTRELKCTCSSQKKDKKSGVYKKRNNKIIKEPILKILKNGDNSIVSEAKVPYESNKNKSNTNRCDPLNLCTLVHNCNQLSISNSNEQSIVIEDVTNDHKWWRKEVISTQEPREPKQQSSHSGSCSQQALNPPCDITIDELASYFETLVHIPKKMSSMAEMMYI